ncbi:hypothetical protein O181_003827 [Austropuccinia psidii MF-1]|uniref:Uncharacterized protein n=1 Tax=Austropuccinia psidii MF-1 TaxID=1389203 RepID=A0A9Q3GF82_9BASI|nr:hypothetical protein [Austropuccinia psidii MF-1]
MKAHIPIGLPEDFYDSHFLRQLSYSEKLDLQIKPEISTSISNLDKILPHNATGYNKWPKQAHILQVGKGKGKSFINPEGPESEDYFYDLGDANMNVKVEEEDDDF